MIMMYRGFTALAFGLLALFAQGSWAAFLGINETPTGVVFSGDANFTANDWLGLISSTQTGTENASMSANLFNPNGGPGTAIVRILDPNGALSDVLTVSFTGGAVGVFTANFCSNDDGNICSSAGFTQTVSENAAGNFAIAVAFLPNMAIAGFSPPDQVPEPGTLALLGLGVAGLAYRRRRKA
jgi:hypothetical protein